MRKVVCKTYFDVGYFCYIFIEKTSDHHKNILLPFFGNANILDKRIYMYSNPNKNFPMCVDIFRRVKISRKR